MVAYKLYLESGPKRRKTMVHVLDLLGCIALGPTTEEALAVTPEAIRAYLRFLHGHDEPADPAAPLEVRIAEHVTEGQWLGNGSPSVTFGPDLQPLSSNEIDTLLRRFRWLTEALAGWAASATDERLDEQPPAGGRTARSVLLHTLAPVGGYLSAALGGAKGFSATAAAAERGELPLADALRRIEAMAAERVRATTQEERTAVRDRGSDLRTLRKALRRMLEHHWEHLRELSRRPGGPAV